MENSFLVEVDRPFKVAAARIPGTPFARLTAVHSTISDEKFIEKLSGVEKAVRKVIAQEGGEIGGVLKSSGVIVVSGITDETKNKLATIPDVFKISPNRDLVL